MSKKRRRRKVAASHFGSSTRNGKNTGNVQAHGDPFWMGGQSKGQKKWGHRRAKKCSPNGSAAS
jgi:hypothetical protein